MSRNSATCQPERDHRTGHVVTVAGALISVIITIAIDSIKGLNLFNVFQSVLGFIAPPMAAVFLFGIFWKRTTTMAANMALTLVRRSAWEWAFSIYGYFLQKNIQHGLTS